MKTYIIRIYNINKSKYGEPFTLCDKHLIQLKQILRTQHCFAKKIGDSYAKCEDCEQEE